MNNTINSVLEPNTCHQCGKDFTIEPNGTSYHIDNETPNTTAHDLDQDHVAYEL